MKGCSAPDTSFLMSRLSSGQYRRGARGGRQLIDRTGLERPHLLRLKSPTSWYGTSFRYMLGRWRSFVSYDRYKHDYLPVSRLWLVISFIVGSAFVVGSEHQDRRLVSSESYIWRGRLSLYSPDSTIYSLKHLFGDVC